MFSLEKFSDCVAFLLGHVVGILQGWLQILFYIVGYRNSIFFLYKVSSIVFLLVLLSFHKQGLFGVSFLPQQFFLNRYYVFLI